MPGWKLDMIYHAFMSYSNAADGKLAPALHSALHQFAKPWYRRRALHIFRDKTTLHPTPQLWGSIRSALEQSSHFILLASPEAAASPWVQREIEYWLTCKPIDRLLIVLTGGTAAWDRTSGAFDAAATTALPASLIRAFAEEPLHLDLRWARERKDLTLRDSSFREAVADLAAALHGRPKDEIIGEDLRQYRRTRRIAWSAVGALGVLTLTSIVAALLAVQQTKAAETQRAAAIEQSRVALARQLAAQSTSIRIQFPDQLQLAVLLAVESTRLHASFEGNQALRSALALLPRPVQSYSFDAYGRGRVRALAFSSDGRSLAAAREEGTADLFDLRRPNAGQTLVPGEKPAAVVDLRAEEKRTTGGSDGRNEMFAVAFSPDGSIVATAGNDGTARLWETASGRELLTVVHGSPVACIAFSPDGKHLATGTDDGRSRVFAFGDVRRLPPDAELDAEEVFPLVLECVHEEEVRRVMFSPDGGYLAAISTDGGISLSRIATREIERAWHAGASGLGIVLSRDGRILATANGNFAYVWDATTGSELFKAMHAKSESDALGHALWIDAVALSPNGELLATGGRDNTARVWNLASGQELIRLIHAAPVESVAFSPDGTMLVTGSFDGTARLWEVSSGSERLRATHWGGAEVAVFSADGKEVASGGMDGSVSVWSLSAGDRLASTTHPSEVRAVGMSRDGQTIASADDRGNLRIWSLDRRTELASAEPVYGPESLAFSEDGRFLAGAARNPSLFMMDLTKGPTPRTLATSRDARDFIVGPHYIVAEGIPAHVRVWETAGGRELARIETANVNRITMDATGRFLAIKQLEGRGETGVIRVRDLAGTDDVGRVPILQRGAGAFALSPGGRLIGQAVDEYDEQSRTSTYYVEVWDVSTGQRSSRIPQPASVVAISFDASGKMLLTIAGNFADDNTRIDVWDWSSKKLRGQLEHRDRISRLRLNGDSTAVATISAGRVNIWNYSTGALVSHLSDAGYVRDVTFSRDGRFVLTGADDGTATLWLWRTQDLQDEACKRLTRNLTSAEWRQYLGSLPYRQTCPNIPTPFKSDDQRN